MNAIRHSPKSTPNPRNQGINGMNVIKTFTGYECLMAFPGNSAKSTVRMSLRHSPKSTPNPRVEFVGYECLIGIPGHSSDYAEGMEDAEGVLVISGFFHNHQVLCNLKTEEIANFIPILTKTLYTRVTLW